MTILSNVIKVDKVAEQLKNRVPLQQIIREGLADMFSVALSVEAEDFLNGCKGFLLPDGSPRVVLAGQTTRSILDINGPLDITLPKLRDKSKDGDKILFQSQLLPPYLRRTKTLEDFIPFLYLKGLSTTDICDTFSNLFGEKANGISTKTVTRSITGWQDEYLLWKRREIVSKYPYVFLDGVFLGVKGLKDNQCILVAIGVNEEGHKEILGISEGYAESTESWKNLMTGLRDQGFEPPLLAIADGARGTRAGVKSVFPDTKFQYCWFHAGMAVTDLLPKGSRPEARRHIREIYLSETKAVAAREIKRFCDVYGEKYPKPGEFLIRHSESLLSFYDFPAVHWAHIRTTNPIESLFSTVKMRARKMRGCASSLSIVSMVYKLAEMASKRFNRIRGAKELGELMKGCKYRDGKVIP
jgi:transposase-like protein